MKHQLLILLLFPVILSAQIQFTDVYLGGGTQFSNTTIPTSFINEFKGNLQDSMPEFDNIENYNNIGLGAIIGFKKMPMFGIDISADYQWSKEQNYSYMTISPYSGYNFGFYSSNQKGTAPTSEDAMAITYDYGFKISNLIVGLGTQAQFQLNERFSFSAGVGVLANFISIDQSGYQINVSTAEWTTSPYSHAANYLTWSLQAKAVVGVALKKGHHIDFGARYVSTTLNDLEPTNEFLISGAPEGSSIPVIPLYKNTMDMETMEQTNTELDLSGVNVFIRYRYRFGGEL